MKKLNLLLALLVLVGVAQGREVIKIGCIFPLSGDNAFLGEPLRELITERVAALPADSRFEYQVVFEDDRLTPRKAVLAAQRLIDLEGVDVVSSFYTACGSAVAPVATRNKTLHWMFCYDEAAADGEFNFNHVTPIGDVAALWLKYARAQGVKNIAFFVHRNGGGEMMLKATRALLNAQDDITYTVERFNPGERDFRMAITKMKAQNPDTLFLYSFDPEFSIILRQMGELDWNPRITAMSVLDQFADKPELNHSWFAAHATPTPEFEAAYRERHGKIAPVGAGVYSDMVDFIYQACEGWEGEGKPTPEQIGERLNQMGPFHGAFGEVKLNEHGLFAVKPTIRVIEDGEPRILEGW